MVNSSKIYIKKIDTIGKFTVWLVDGEYVRKEIDENFVECDHHYHFKFIPQNEFWIDQATDPLELPYFIDNLLVEYRLMEKGVSYEEALRQGDLCEKRERAKSASFQYLCEGTNKMSVVEKIHRELLTKYSHGEMKVWIVDGKLVRDFFLTEFIDGGHDLVYAFVPKNEIWIEEVLSPDGKKYILLHELHEHALMLQGKKYREAHKGATIVEDYHRDHPDELEERILVELKKNNDFLKEAKGTCETASCWWRKILSLLGY